MTKNPFQGTGTAMVTPFTDDGTIDEKALRRFVDFQIDGGVDMLLPCGTTGEGAEAGVCACTPNAVTVAPMISAPTRLPITDPSPPERLPA